MTRFVMPDSIRHPFHITMSLRSKIESLLFISARSFTANKLAELTGEKKEKVEGVLDELVKEYADKDSGVRIVKLAQSYQMSTSPENAKLVQDYLKDETTGELTRPSLETLTIIAYRGPISKVELEQIRGVNCGQILRNLKIRGLIESREDKRTDNFYYNITMDFMKFLGIGNVKELPDYEKLNRDKNLESLFSQEKEVSPAQKASEEDASQDEV